MPSPATSTRGKGSAGRTGSRRRSAAARPRSGSRRSRWAGPVPELPDLCRAAVEAAEGEEAVEAYAEESRRTEASALRGEVEGLEFAESRGVGVRVVRDGRLGYAWAADPDADEVRAIVRLARENAALSGADEHQVLPEPSPWEPIPALFREASAQVPPETKTKLALDLEARAVACDPRVTKIDEAQVGDAVSRVAIASTAGVEAEYARTDAWCLAVTLAVDDDGTNVEGPGAAPFDDEGVPSGRTELFTKGVLNGFLHHAYTEHKGGTASA